MEFKLTAKEMAMVQVLRESGKEGVDTRFNSEQILRNLAHKGVAQKINGGWDAQIRMAYSVYALTQYFMERVG